MDKVQFARRFVIRQPGQQDIHGVAFPSGIVLYDQPGIGLEAATSIDHVRLATLDATVADTDEAIVHWAEEADAHAVG
ncbi:hypothetical protein EDD90_7383 [Streptomyces sp. Ag109_O5-1]|uniref:hypothetical protein n=1 Tax=Streptomyces sp. Ag109_O5-1 TaxID=1938851 RepID=UPI000F4DC4F8|nr:hypothetical protein [Streptomyces sp. Ag109_O5-1]RPE44153.1 hypothetical protein EDD90_7383 [Streptomyces sp. Ag109_O5-1]